MKSGSLNEEPESKRELKTFLVEGNIEEWRCEKLFPVSIEVFVWMIEPSEELKSEFKDEDSSCESVQSEDEVLKEFF